MASIPIIIATGGAATPTLTPALYFVPTAAAIILLLMAVGSTIAISLFSEWDYVELSFGIKMRLRGA